ncbi:HlyC/CorC family transporter [Bacillus luteolus]|uniref:HlyC/CorC family transporter n=1 Tax=Litchfieldia luteola TaxID=682179 RepID=A0ABR9QKM9_9BACI|nr:hemolysin family protein [Cytobacillus luteolus]MBE4909060.1 HlyC/CorC family transporter [Cytobacillus luteolus]MBP1941916.1 putative hemolysin [Cytobacillus luteolus]
MSMELIILLILIILNAFFAASEIALISLNDNKVKLMADSGDKKAIMLYNLLDEPSRFLATIQIGITLAGFLASAFAAGSFAGKLTDLLITFGVPLPARLLDTLSVIVVTLILSYFTLVVGELVPKRLALQKAEAISMFAVAPLTFLSKISSPFVKLLTFSTNTIVRLFGVDPNAEDENVTEEEIRMMVDVGKERGTIQEAEKIMINNIFEFDNKTVSDIMTHRTNIVAIPLQYTLKETTRLVLDERYTRFPVYEENIDNIIGVLHSKDLIQFIENCEEERFNIRELLRDPYFVLESKQIDDLLKEMQEFNIHMAIAVDEYGGTDGIITIEDIIEEIVGNIFDEYDENEEDKNEIVELGNGQYLIAGSANLYTVEEIVKMDLPTDEFDTISGFVIGQIGYIPSAHDLPIVEYQNIIFSIEEMSDKRIMKVKITVKENEVNKD